MGQAKWENFTKEELEEMWYNCLTKLDFAKQLGYSSSGHIKEIQKKLQLLDEDLGKNNPNKKRTMIGPKGIRIEDLSGQVFGHWHVLALDEEKTKNDFKHSWWICQCDCKKQTIKSITMNNLKRGKTKSCGCDLFYAEDMIGQKFGKLKVLSIDLKANTKRKKVICRCDCGKIKSIFARDIKSGHTNSCGCLGSSLGEYKLEQLFIKNNIYYEKEFSFDDLKGDSSSLRFDFKIIYNGIPYLIEFQGIQHYESVKNFGGITAFEKQKKYDNKKRQYCKDKKIILITIPYWDIDKINEDYIKERLNEYNN